MRSITNASLTIVFPIIGPPAINFTESSVYPPQAAIISLAGIPTGTITFFGSFTAVPDTVTVFLTIARPCNNASPNAIAVVALFTTAPTSPGKRSYSLCMISRTNTRSHPIGYTSGTAAIETPSSPFTASSTKEIKS